ncbi:hypothetical protein [Hazenella coriacea]|uniref:Uncharacterized protein n=1 Tax=Hazenella coriacea TaxID=1179467 RepID=A0A4R3LBH4_9BACL|nr:hypothetical protein [Hazenella coriacea]TCS94866.1 hypothetical protein EDD58_103289 [Hazenella coriacea]
MGRRKELKGDLVSFKLYKEDLQLLDLYAKQLKSSRSKIVSYFLYEMFIKQQPLNFYRMSEIVEEMNLTAKKRLTSNINLYVRKETKTLIDQVRSQIFETTGKKINRNIFIGAIITYALYQQLKKNQLKQLSLEDLQSKQVAIYLKNSLYTKVIQHIESHRISFQLLLLDSLEDPQLEEGLPLFEIKDSPNETAGSSRVITLLPYYLYKKIKRLPLHLSFIASIQLQKHLNQYA